MNRAAFQAAEQHMMDLEASNVSLTMDDDNNFQLEQQLGLLRALQAAEMGDHGGGVPPHILHEMNMLGMDPNDAESMQALFQMMAQQEQENARPDEHYLTIAQNGKNIFDLECFLGLDFSATRVLEIISSHSTLLISPFVRYNRNDIRSHKNSYRFSTRCFVNDISVSNRQSKIFIWICTSCMLCMDRNTYPSMNYCFCL